MDLIDFISKDNIYVSPLDTVSVVLEVLNNTNYSHVPVVDGERLIGSVAKEDLLSVDNKSHKISELEYLCEFFFADEDSVLLQVFSDFAVNNTNILPIVNAQKKYVGYVDLHDALDCFADTDFLNEEGSVLLLEKNTQEYSMSEICQIVETNNNMVLGSFVSKTNKETTIITLKVKSVHINELIQSFRRYDYVVVNNLIEDSYLEGLKKRSEYFIKYLNI